MSEPDKECSQQPVLSDLRNELDKYKKLLEQFSKEQQKHIEAVNQLKKDLGDHRAAVELRVERISDVLVTNISHLRALLDNLSALSDRIGYCEHFTMRHGYEYNAAMDKLKTNETKVNKVESNVDKLKESVAKEVSTLKKNDDVQNKYHWKLGVIVTVGGGALALLVRVGSVQELLTALFEWLSGK